MSSDRSARAWATGGLLLAGLLVSVGTAWAFERGGLDFNVFYQAWSYVLSGRSSEIYFYTPDRFLYAPGFAFLLSPLALLPRTASLLVWCLLKAAVLGLVFGSVGNDLFRGQETRLQGRHWIAAGFAAWAAVFWGRPLLIDLQYGQVNIFIFASCYWALRCHAFERGKTETTLAWAFAAMAAATKVFPLPILIVPGLSATAGTSRIRSERIGMLLGLLFFLLVPFFFLGAHGGIALYAKWQEELLSKGLPLESHNQSFLALLYHFFSGATTHVISQGPQGWFKFAMFEFPQPIIQSLGWGWALATMGWLLFILMRGPGTYRHPLRWIAIATSLLIIPSHLVWKTYFLFGIPAAAWVIERARKSATPMVPLATLALFALVNFSGFDFLGAYWGARVEAASTLLFCHLALIAMI